MYFTMLLVLKGYRAGAQYSQLTAAPIWCQIVFKTVWTFCIQCYLQTVWFFAFLFFASLVTGSESRPSRARALRQLREQSRASQHLTCPCILILCRLRLDLLLKSCLQISQAYFIHKKKLTLRQLLTLADQVNMAHGGN